MQNYGDTLKNLRKTPNMTQEHLAKLIGISQDRVSRLENESDNMTVE